MKYMLDTNICIYIIKKRPPEVLQTLQSHSIGDLFISSITVAELEYGVAKSSRPEQNRIALAQFLAPFEILNFDDNAAKAFGTIRASLEKAGKVIGPFDMQIAAHALSEDLIVVTNNMKEFERVEGLTVENWV